MSEDTAVGKWEWWYPNGKLEQAEWYLAGSYHGLITKWYPNGSKKSEGSFVKGAREGTYSVWDEKGNLSLQVDFKADYPVDFDHHQATKAKLTSLLEITASNVVEDAYWLTDKSDKYFIFGRGEAAFLKTVGQPDSGYQPADIGSQNFKQVWGFQCRDGVVQFPVMVYPNVVYVNPPPGFK